MAGTHAVLTGDTRRFGNKVTLPDGRVVDTSAALIHLDSHDDALEVAHLIGLAHEKHGHPDDVEIDAESGEPVQRAFVYDRSNYEAHVRGQKG